MDESQNLTIAPSYMETAHPNLIKWQLDYEGDLKKLKHEWAGEVPEMRSDGVAWVKKLKPKMNEEGLNTIIPYVRSMISKSPLSNLTEDEVNKICLTVGRNIADVLFLKYDIFEIDKNFLSIIVDQATDFVYIVLKRAQDEGERHFLKETSQVTEVHTDGGAGDSKSVFGKLFKN